jgi:ADP-heptose:LPS heptosyltransferase
MGFGDAIMASGLARGLHAQGKLAAFFSPADNHRKIKWTGYCEDIFFHNPNIARPNQEKQDNLIWYPHYKKQFPYTHFDGKARKYIWHYDFKASPGEFFFTAEETAPPLVVQKPFIVIEPNLAWQRQVNHNKDWGEGKYEKLAQRFIESGLTVVQFIHGNSRRRVPATHHIATPKFHQAAAIMSHASLIIAPEGANHHAAAALNIPAVIVWGAWSPPQTMGYESQIKLTGGASEACGKIDSCSHCREAMDRISIDEVYEAAQDWLR